jgi:hypothetical protein
VTVRRIRFFDAIPEELRELVMPPPNISERPPPWPRFKSTKSTAITLVIAMITMSTVMRVSTVDLPVGIGGY